MLNVCEQIKLIYFKKKIISIPELEKNQYRNTDIASPISKSQLLSIKIEREVSRIYLVFTSLENASISFEIFC